MGCACTRTSSARDRALDTSARPLTVEEKRAAQLRAAEDRERSNLNRGVGGEASAARLREQRLKDELVGKITGVYVATGQEVPLGLNLASVEALKLHYKKLVG
jgi:biotin carboxyl carrier protein